MFTVTNDAGASSTTNGSPYANDLADLQPDLQALFATIAFEYVNPTTDNLKITTDTPSFIQSGMGNDTITDNNNSVIDSAVAIDPGGVKIGGINNIQAGSNPKSHDFIIVDAESDAPLTDKITGLKVGDSVLIKGLTALPPPNDLSNTTFDMLPGLMVTTHLPPTAPATAQIFLSGYNTNDLASGGRLKHTAFTSPNMPEASSYLRLEVIS